MRDVLLIRFGSLGDVVLVLPVVSALRASPAPPRISVAVKEEFSSLFEGSPGVAKVFPLRPSGIHRGISGLRRYADALRRESFDHIVDLHGSARSRLLTHWLRGPLLWRIRTDHLRRRALVRFKRPVFGYPGHIVDRYLATIHGAVGSAVSRRPELGIPEGPRARADAWLRERGVAANDRLIALAPGAGRATKRWAEKRYAELASGLVSEASQSVVILGSEGERNLVARVSALAGHPRVLPFSSSNLMEQGALLARASRLVSNDSGFMHLGVAVGTPVVALFGPTSLSLGFRPLGDQDAVLSVPLKCRPCGLHGLPDCPRGDHACMERISVERVIGAVLDGAGEGQ